jgi:hypothetical protein
MRMPPGRNDEGVLRFRLYDVADARMLGEFETVEAAFAAADQHLLEVLAQAGEWVTVEHLVAYLDDVGQLQVCSECTHVGPPGDLESCRAWLSALPGRRGVLL